MLPKQRVLLEDEACPFPDETLGEIYRASTHGVAKSLQLSQRQQGSCLQCTATAALTLPRSDWQSWQLARKTI
jgi:hypothetical protein